MSADAPPPEERKRVVLVDGHPVLRESLCHYLAGEGLEVVGQAGSVAEAVPLVDGLNPDLVITDLSLPDASGTDLIRALNANGHDRVPKLVLSMHDESVYALRALRAGAHGYLMKGAASEVLVDVVWTLLRGGFYVSPEQASRMQSIKADLIRADADGSDITDILDASAYEMFHMLGQGMTIMGIADRLQIGVEGVEGKLEDIRQKLELEDFGALVREAVQWVASRDVHDVRTLLKILTNDAHASLTKPKNPRTQEPKNPNDDEDEGTKRNLGGGIGAGVLPHHADAWVLEGGRREMRFPTGQQVGRWGARQAAQRREYREG